MRNCDTTSNLVPLPGRVVCGACSKVICSSFGTMALGANHLRCVFELVSNAFQVHLIGAAMAFIAGKGLRGRRNPVGNQLVGFRVNKGVWFTAVESHVDYPCGNCCSNSVSRVSKNSRPVYACIYCNENI